MPTLHTPDTISTARHLPSWLLLAGAAGTVNGFGFLACQQFVTHVTGTATRLGLEWPHVGIAAEYAAVLLSFVAGALASVFALQARALRGERPLWAAPLVVVAGILLGVAVAGHLGAFGPLGALPADEPPAALLSLLAFAMGLQNAAVGTMTGLAVRTTHLTGPATDLGIHLGTACFARGGQRRAALKGAVLRGGKAVAFVAGAGLALPLSVAFGYFALLAPAAVVLAAAALSFVPAWGPSDFPAPQEDAGGEGPAGRARRTQSNGGGRPARAPECGPGTEGVAALNGWLLAPPPAPRPRSGSPGRAATATVASRGIAGDRRAAPAFAIPPVTRYPEPLALLWLRFST